MALQGFTTQEGNQTLTFKVVADGKEGNGPYYVFAECKEKPERRGFFTQHYIDTNSTWQDIN